MISMAGTDKDFMVSLQVLKSYLNQFQSLREKYDFETINYGKNENMDTILRKIENYNAKIICFSCYTWNMGIFEKVINSLKNKIVIVGGPEITLEDVKKGRFDNLNADYFIFGEGEIPFYTILKTLDNPKISRVGVIYKDSKFYYSEHCFLDNLSEQPISFTENNIPCELMKKESIRVNIK